MSEWEIKHLQNRLESQEKRLDDLNGTIRKLQRKTQDKYYRAITWMMLLSFAVFLSFLILHAHKSDIDLIQARQAQSTNDAIKKTEISKKTT